MKSVKLLQAVKKHPKLSRYHQLCWKFLVYLRDKENIMILIEMYDDKESDLDVIVKPYMHRWKREYMRARLAMFYKLEEWAKNNPMPLTMLTFTTFHDSAYSRRKNGQSYTIEESWGILKNGFRRASMLIRNKIRPGVSYFWIVEPQGESGYPHIHAGYFTEFTDEEKDRLKNHWANIVKAGDYNHGLDFSFGSNFQPGDISSFRNYLMKYCGKTFGTIAPNWNLSESEELAFKEIDPSWNPEECSIWEGMPDWSPEELVFNAVAWHEGYRFFGCSQDLSKAMARIKKENTDIIWLRTSIIGSNMTDDLNIIISQNKRIKLPIDT